MEIIWNNENQIEDVELIFSLFHTGQIKRKFEILERVEKYEIK